MMARKQRREKLHSFLHALWRQTVALQALPWKPAEVSSAAELRNTILSVILRRAAALARVNTELERSNVELDAFAYITSQLALYLIYSATFATSVPQGRSARQRMA
jgi:light-regulated signal transduction histidine kinase (bacteriophytochrome)